MESRKLVLPEHLNRYGFLFGGNMLKWVDEMGWIAASMDYPGCNFVTRAMDRVEFKSSVKEGVTLRFDVVRTGTGSSSVTYSVEVFAAGADSAQQEAVFSTNITYVCVDAEGNKHPIIEARPDSPTE